MTGKLLVRLFALFGMTLTCVACYGVEYTEFNAEFGASGRVVDESGTPIEGIEARCGENRTTTDENGRFHIYGTKPWLTLTDTDGEANGGDFATYEKDLSAFPKSQIKEGEGWFRGEYEVTADVQLNKK